jgi:glycosyltransferase involved in cell wall biosynthesis
MRILLINYRYFLSGGPEKYMFAVKELLEKNSHEVIPFSIKSNRNVKNDYERYFVDPIGGEDKVYFEDYKKDPKTLMQIIDRQFYSKEVKKKLEILIKDTKPDVAYLLHHYNKLSPSVIDACRKHKVPIVMRVSDFFLVCPNALLLRDNKVCEECIKRSLLCGIKYRCVKKSFMGSAIKVSAMLYHRFLHIYDKVSYIIAPSEFTLTKLTKKFNQKKLVHIPSFIESKEKYNPDVEDYLLYVGRLEEEKGVLDAIKAVKDTKYHFRIVGKSSTNYEKVISEYIKSNDLKNVELLGAVYDKELSNLYKDAKAVILPAVWYENMPNVALEAMAYSKPLLVSDIGSLKELVKEGYNGLLFEPGNIEQIKQKIQILFEDIKLCKKLGKNGFDLANEKYSSEKHYKQLIGLFEKSIDEAK